MSDVVDESMRIHVVLEGGEDVRSSKTLWVAKYKAKQCPTAEPRSGRSFDRCRYISTAHAEMFLDSDSPPASNGGDAGRKCN